MFYLLESDVDNLANAFQAPQSRGLQRKPTEERQKYNLGKNKYFIVILELFEIRKEEGKDTKEESLSISKIKLIINISSTRV